MIGHLEETIRSGNLRLVGQAVNRPRYNDTLTFSVIEVVVQVSPPPSDGSQGAANQPFYGSLSPVPSPDRTDRLRPGQSVNGPAAMRLIIAVQTRGPPAPKQPFIAAAGIG